MSKNIERENLLNGNIRTVFFKYLIASIGGMLGTSLYVLGDTMLVGRLLGSEGLAALNISIPMINVFNGFGLLFGIGGATALSIDRGRGKNKDSNRIFNISMMMSLIVGVILTLIRVFYLDELVYFLGGDETTFQMSKSYLGVLMSFSIAFLLNSTLTVFVRNDGSPRLAMAGMLVGSVVNVILDYIFMGPMRLGMAGGALATGISPVLGLLIVNIHFLKTNSNISYKLTGLDMNIFSRITRNGFASFIIELSSGIVIFAFNKIILDIVGNIGVSAYSIIANLSLICTAIFTGIGQAIQPIVSVNYGAENEKRVLESVKLAVITAVIFGVIFYLVGLFFPKGLVAIFNDDKGQLMDITVRGIKIYFSAFLIMGINIVMTSYIQSKENRRAATIISLLRGFIFIIILLIILPKIIGLDGVWLTMPMAELFTLIFYMLIFKESRRVLIYTFNNKI